MKNNISKYLMIVLCVLASMPMLLQLSSLSSSSLGGYVEKAAKPVWAFDYWFSGKHQTQQEKYLSESYGFRDYLIRLNNQYKFSFFKKSNVKDIIIGKENYLYGEGYIRAYMGSDSFDDEGVKMKVKRLTAVSKKLEVMGTKLVVVRAAGKASYFPEFIPDQFFLRKKTNIIDAYKKELTKSGLLYIDFNDWFLQMKDTCSYPLFTRTGIHWSQYGAVIAADSLIRYLEKLKSVDLPDLTIKNIEFSSLPRKSDNDIEKSMNLIFSIANDKYAYPEFDIISENKDSLKVLVAGDSYYWQLYNVGLTTDVFSESQFIYYGRLVYPGKKKLEDIGTLNIITDHDVFVLMCTEANLQHFPWGIHSALYEELCKEDIELFIQTNLDEILEMENKIRADKKWFDLIVKQAENQKTSIEEELRRDALYMVEAAHLDD